MEDINEPNEQNRINLEENTNPLTILSILYNFYQELEKSPNNEAENNKKDKNIINDLKIKNDDDFPKAINNRLEEIKNNTLSRINSSIDTYKACYEKYQKRIVAFIEEKGNNLSKIINNNSKNYIILDYVIKNIFNKINNIFELYDNILNNIEENFVLLNDIMLEKNHLFQHKKPIEKFFNHYYKNILNCSLINKFNFNHIDNSYIHDNNYYRNYFNFLKDEKNKEVFKTLKIKRQKNEEDKKREEDIKKEEEKMEYIKEIFPSIEKLELKGINRNYFETFINNITSISIYSHKKDNYFIF